MEKISKPINNMQDYIQNLCDVCIKHGMESPLINKMLKVRTNGEKTLYEFENKSFLFPEKDFFKMRLLEKGQFPNKSTVDILKYTYHGHYIDSSTVDFIRFDFEPHTRNYAPLHINANEKKWGDHLTFPNDTNLDIDKINLEKALNVFNKYSEDKSQFPLDESSNQDYIKIIEGDNKNE